MVPLFYFIPLLEVSKGTGTFTCYLLFLIFRIETCFICVRWKYLLLQQKERMIYTPSLPLV